MVELSQNVLQALDEAKPGPVQAVDPRNNERYVILPEDLYQRIRAISDESLSPEETGALIEQAMREYDADDPLLESYQVYKQ